MTDTDFTSIAKEITQKAIDKARETSIDEHKLKNETIQALNDFMYTSNRQYVTDGHCMFCGETDFSVEENYLTHSDECPVFALLSTMKKMESSDDAPVHTDEDEDTDENTEKDE